MAFKVAKSVLSLIPLTVLIRSLLSSGNSELNNFVCLSLLVILMSNLFFLIFSFSTKFSNLSLDISFYLYFLAVAWNCIDAAYSSFEAFISYYHTLVMEFAKKLLIIEEYYSQNFIFYINSRLLKIRLLLLPILLFLTLIVFLLKKLYRIFLSLISISFPLLTLFLSQLVIIVLFLKL